MAQTAKIVPAPEGTWTHRFSLEGLTETILGTSKRKVKPGSSHKESRLHFQDRASLETFCTRRGIQITE